MQVDCCQRFQICRGDDQVSVEHVTRKDRSAFRAESTGAVVDLTGQRDCWIDK
jgi:hypothetical protein